MQLVYTSLLAHAAPDSDLLGSRREEEIVLVDVGANSGCFALMAIDPPALRVLAIEPVLHTFRVLERNLALNHLQVHSLCPTPDTPHPTPYSPIP